MLGGDFQRRIKTWFRRHLSGVVKHQPPVMLSPWVHFALLASVISEVFELELFFNESLRPVLDLLVLGVYAVVVWQISRRAMVVGAIVLPGGIAEMLNVWGTPQWTVDFQSGFSFLCHFALAVVLMRRILTTRHISSREILDAISLYVIAALAFANLYGAILWNHPGALTCFYMPEGQPLPFSMVLYYSFTSQLTMGYGDVVPMHQLTRAVSMVQGLFGVMFTSILISWFVSMHSASFMTRNRPPEQ